MLSIGSFIDENEKLNIENKIIESRKSREQILKDNRLYYEIKVKIK